MKIDKFKVRHLRNATYFQFHAYCLNQDFQDWQQKSKNQTAQSLRLVYRINRINQINSSLNIGKIFESCESGFRQKVATKPLNDQTSLTYNILQEFEDNYAEDVKTVGIAQWLSELKERNSTVNNLMKERFDEIASKNDVVLKDARAELDSIYNAIVERINAFALVEEESKVYGDFIKTWNVIVDKYAAGLRRGKKGQNQDLQLLEPGLAELVAENHKSNRPVASLGVEDSQDNINQENSSLK